MPDAKDQKNNGRQTDQDDDLIEVKDEDVIELSGDGPPPLPQKPVGPPPIRPEMLRSMRERQAQKEIEELSDADILGPAEMTREEFERERRGRERLLSALSDKGLEPRLALELVANFDPRAINEGFLANVRDRTQSYGLKFDELPADTQQELLVMTLGAERGKSASAQQEISEAVEVVIHRELFEKAIGRIDGLEGALNEKLEAGELKDRLRGVMEALNTLSKQVPLDKEDNLALWHDLFRRFDVLTQAKRKTGEPDIHQALSEVFDEFSDFIEDDVVAYFMKSAGTASIEDVMHRVYGRSKAEVEGLKKRNRANVAAEIMKMKDEPNLTIDMLERLHAVNNQGIVPKKFSRLRSGPMISIFGEARRIGLLSEDVRPEMEALMERANDLVDRDVVTDMSKLRYEIEAAGLHNDLLDMHAFADRNGSTSLLFLELLMARKGYQPPAERNSDYYNHLRKILGNNPVAVAVVGYEHYRIKYQPGFYEGRTMTEEKRERYEDVGRLLRAKLGGKPAKKRKASPRSEQRAG